MNSLQQDSSLLIGAKESIESLSQQEKATILAISDSHGAGMMVSYILREWGAKSDALVFCGDGIGDVCHILSESINDKDLANCLPPVIAMVQGNNDAGRYPVRKPANGETEDSYAELEIPLSQTLTVCGHKLFITHGHRFSLYNGTSYLAHEARSEGAEAALYGHTHIALAECSFGTQTLNPGSCARPRGGLPPSFMTLSLKKGSAFYDYSFYRINGAKSVPFNPEPMMFYW